MVKKFTIEEFDKQMEEIIANYPLIQPSAGSSLTRGITTTPKLNPIDVKEKVLAAARRRAASLRQPGSLI